MCSRKGAASPATSSSGCWPGHASVSTLTRTDLEECVRSTAITPELVETLRRLLAVDGIALDASVDDPPISFLREIEAEVDAAEALAYETELEAAAEPVAAEASRRRRRRRRVRRPVDDDEPAARRRRPPPGPHALDQPRRTPCACRGEIQTWAARPTRCACTSRRSAGSRCSPAQEEVDLAKRIERARFAEERLAELNAAGEIASLDPASGAGSSASPTTAPTPRPRSPRPTCASSCRSPSATSVGACSSST